MFPETWSSQSRPKDPDSATSKRKRKSKPKTNVVVETEVPTATKITPPITEENPSPKRVCHKLDSHHHAPITSTTESLLPQRIDYQRSQIRAEEQENAFKPVDVQVTTEAEVPPVILDIHSLISRLPYSQMLNQVFTDDANSTVVVPVVTRAYEESFMREPINANERSCVCGDNCECNFIDPLMPFVGVEFTLGDTSTSIAE